MFCWLGNWEGIMIRFLDLGVGEILKYLNGNILGIKNGNLEVCVL